MAKPDFQARPGLRGGTTPESSVPHGEDARGREDAVADGAEEKDGAEWGFAPKSGGVSREAKIGLRLSLVLAVAFGFVYYRKTHAKDLLAAAAMDDVAPDETPPKEQATPKLKPRSSAPNDLAGGSPFSDDPPPVRAGRPNRPGRKPVPLDDFA